jgi:hypothetical protein
VYETYNRRLDDDPSSGSLKGDLGKDDRTILKRILKKTGCGNMVKAKGRGKGKVVPLLK